MPDLDLHSYGLADEQRTLHLLRVLHECAQDTAMIDFGLMVLDADDETQVFLRHLTGKITDRIAPLIDALSGEYLFLKRLNSDHEVIH